MAHDRTEELKRSIEEIDGTHDQWLRRAAFFLGRLQMRFSNNPLGRFILAKFTTRILAYIIVEKELFGVEKGKKDDLLEIALNWLKPSILFRIPTEVAEASDERVVILRPECTVGFKDPSFAQLCRASMNMDMKIIRRLGGKLAVTDTILEGAPKCKHIITRGD